MVFIRGRSAMVVRFFLVHILTIKTNRLFYGQGGNCKTSSGPLLSHSNSVEKLTIASGSWAGQLGDGVSSVLGTTSIRS